MNSTSAPTVRSLVVVPATITLAITLLRLVLELSHAPGWLANSAGGGGGALIGIVWLPLLFGPWFALRLRPHFDSTKALLKQLAKTLFAYGILARIPVVLITIPAVIGKWGTHYDQIPFDIGVPAKIAVTMGVQFLVWDCIWTIGAGTLAGFLATKFRAAPRSDAAAA